MSQSPGALTVPACSILTVMTSITFIPSRGYSQEDHDRLAHDNRRICILYDESPVVGALSERLQILAPDYPLAVLTHFSPLCARHIAMHGLDIIRLDDIPTETITMPGPRGGFQYFQEVFKFIFDFYCQGTATVAAGRLPTYQLWHIGLIASDLGVQILQKEVARQLTKVSQCIPLSEDVAMLLGDFPPGNAAREHLAKVLSRHLIKGTLPLKCKTLRDLFRDHHEFSDLMMRDRLENAEAYKKPKLPLTSRQMKLLKELGWQIDEDSRPVVEGGKKQGSEIDVIVLD